MIMAKSNGMRVGTKVVWCFVGLLVLDIKLVCIYQLSSAAWLRSSFGSCSVKQNIRVTFVVSQERRCTAGGESEQY